MGEDPLDDVDPRPLGARLRVAREARGLTQQQAASHLGVARTTMVALEKGERRLKPEELVALAGLYQEPVSTLLQRGEPAEDLVAQLRGALPPGARRGEELDAALEELRGLCEDYVRLEALCQAPLGRRLPAPYEVRGLDPELAAEDVAAAERNRLGLGEGPLLNLRETLEAEVGLRVFQLDLPPGVAGMLASTEELGACLAVSLRQPPELRRDALGQELGQLLTAPSRADVLLAGAYDRKPAKRRFAEAFARAFLMPAPGLRHRFLELGRERPRGIPQGELCRLARYYAVSIEAMTRRLEELRLLPGDTWERLGREAASVGEPPSLFGLPSPAADDELLPARYVALAVEAWQRGELSEGQLARFLRTDRLGARARIASLAPGGAGEPGTALDLSAPLPGSAAG